MICGLEMCNELYDKSVHTKSNVDGENVKKL